jgi:hypothetical protein
MPPGLLRWLAEYLECIHIARQVQHNMIIIIKIICLSKKTWILEHNITGVFVKPDTYTHL